MLNNVEDKLVAARVRLLLNMPFFGNLATRLKLIKAEWLPTAGTDGRHLYYNEEFINKLDKKEIEFLLAHECMHCCYDHMERRGSRNPELWNCAADFLINWELHEQNVGKLIVRPGEIEPCFDAKYKGMGADEIYKLLEQDPNFKPEQHQFDIHLEPGGGEEEGDGDGEGGEGEGNGKKRRIKLSEEERRQIKDEVKQAVMQAAKAAGAGNVPSSVREMINDLTDPKMDWREILNMDMQSTLKSDYTFMRPSRKSQMSGIILPGMDNDFMVEAAIAIDTSGSISTKMLRDFLSEIKGIMEQFPDFKLWVWNFDTKVHNMELFTPDNAEDLLKFEIKGRGGTEFDCNWEWMKEHDIMPQKFIMFTDGYPWNSWGDEDYCDTTFLMHGTKTIVAPFGDSVYYEEEAE